MSTKEELETKLQKINNIIQNRKNEVNNLKLCGKIQKVAETYGDHSDWGGGEYHFSEKGLSIRYTYHSDKHLEVDLGYGTKDVFRAKPLENGVGEIYLYIPGEWENQIEKLYSEIPQIEENHEINNIQNKISELKKEWQLEV